MINRILILAAVALSLGGCAGVKSVLDVVPFVTTSIDNPVTPKMLYQAEQSLTVAVSGMLAYKRLCIRKVIDRSCRQVIADLQVYTRQAKPVLVRLRGFVRNNDQVNAIMAFNEVRGLLTSFQQKAVASGVAVAAN